MTVPELASKQCSKCGETKPLSEYYRAEKNRDGLDGWCRTCVKTHVTDAHARRREEMGEEAWLAHRAEITRRSRSKPEVRERALLSAAAYRAALSRLRDLHPEQFEKLLAIERYDRGLT